MSSIVVCVSMLLLPAISQAQNNDPNSASEGSVLPLFLVDDTLDAASRYRTETQQKVLELASDGSADLHDLISIIVTDNAEVLDHLVVNLASQHIYECNINGEVLRSEPVSTGRAGYLTPPGDYTIVNRAPKAYSEKYEAWMLHWMGITRDGGYGLHGLEGSSYERLLGRVASHGCIRLSRSYAEDLYTRIKIGLPVLIRDDQDLELPQYRPLTRQAAEAMVLQIISPADPWEVFY